MNIFDLSPAEKLQLVQDLWDDLAASPDDVPIGDSQIAELERRKANLQKKPGVRPDLGRNQTPHSEPTWALNW